VVPRSIPMILLIELTSSLTINLVALSNMRGRAIPAALVQSHYQI
jgi:hypothetical protein